MLGQVRTLPRVHLTRALNSVSDLPLRLCVNVADKNSESERYSRRRIRITCEQVGRFATPFHGCSFSACTLPYHEGTRENAWQ